MTTKKSARDTLVEEYLLRLETALAQTEPLERVEILTSVREHFKFALPVDASGQQVELVLTGLGTPESIARASTQSGTLDRGQGSDKGVDQTSLLLLVGAVISAFMLLVFAIPSLIIAAICFVGSVVDLRTKQGSRGIAIAALLLSTVGLVMNPLVSGTLLALILTANL